ncbi:hypothetical protein [Flavobacterium sp. UBA6031]|uniref:hypothetical protein n=1 Tax=Flavobacterium sp. UBA6031 TaxID=1946551 RepID=UPI0025C1BC1E|nr:hypothetical protein [Flavobacterium sp. UBA6031]
MEKLIEDLISRIEIERTHSFRVIENSGLSDKTLENIHTGKIFAFDFCTNELRRLLDYQNANENKHKRS